MSYQETAENTLRAAIADSDPLTKAWGTGVVTRLQPDQP